MQNNLIFYAALYCFETSKQLYMFDSLLYYFLYYRNYNFINICTFAP